jgi:hypothetical protein
MRGWLRAALCAAVSTGVPLAFRWMDISVSLRVVPFEAELVWVDGGVDHDASTQQRLTVLSGERRRYDVVFVHRVPLPGVCVPMGYWRLLCVQVCLQGCTLLSPAVVARVCEEGGGGKGVYVCGLPEPKPEWMHGSGWGNFAPHGGGRRKTALVCWPWA